MPVNKFWKFRNAAETDGGAELLLYGEIASEQSWYADAVTPQTFTEELRSLGAVQEITVRINSGGGDVFAAHTIGNLLESHEARVTARIDGVCASAATIVACHCDRVIAANDSAYMIHPVKMGICGYVDADTLRQYQDALTALRENIIGLYAKKTGKEKDEVAAWMDGTSWWTAAEAREHGFVDELTDDGQETVENRNGVLFVNGVGMGVPWQSAPEFVRNRQAVNNEQKEERTMAEKITTADDLRREYPALVEEIERTAAENATAAERQRIRDIEEVTLPGSETIAAEAKYEKPVSAADFAVAVAKNAKAQGAAYLAQRAQTAETSGVNSVPNVPPADDREKDAAFLAAIREQAKQ